MRIIYYVNDDTTSGHLDGLCISHPGNFLTSLKKIRMPGVSLGGEGENGHRLYNSLMHKNACTYTFALYFNKSYINF